MERPSKKVAAIMLFSTLLSVVVCLLLYKTHDLHIITTGDIHGAWFDEPYGCGEARPSLMSVSRAVSEVCSAVGAENLLLLDAGDCLQGDQAAYYYNYVDTLSPHVFPQIASYMGYDAIAVGNHDIEAGHAVYDRVRRDLDAYGIPWLAGNAVGDDGNPYFQEYTVVRKAGLKVLIMGYTNADIRSWVSEEQFAGMEFKSLVPFVQERVDALRRRFNPQVTILVVHSGTGKGDASVLENQGMDLMQCRGVDLILCGHDHKAVFRQSDSGCCLVNSGSRAATACQALIRVRTFGRKVLSKASTAMVVKVPADDVDTVMKERFRPQFEAVKSFTLQPVGEMDFDMNMRDALAGRCPYMDLIHTVQLSVPEARLSFSAPFNSDSVLPRGQLLYRDMFTIYPFENQLFVVNMTGREIKDYLEFSYDGWLRKGDTPVYNYDSCAGLVYSVRSSSPVGERVRVLSLADGSAFDYDALYPVAMTSYRAYGGGNHMSRGAGIPKSVLESRIIARYPDVRDMIYMYIKEHGQLDAGLVGDRSVLGDWKFDR